MKTKFKSYIRASCPSFCSAVCAGAVMLIATSAQAQNLYVSAGDDTITKITPAGTKSIFGFGQYPEGLAFNGAGNLFEADFGTGSINEFTPSGVESSYATGLDHPFGLTF